MHRDIALDALLHPFAEGALRWPPAGDALFLRAREGAALHARGGLQALACTQPFKPEADRLQRIGVHPPQSLTGRVIVTITRRSEQVVLRDPVAPKGL